MTDPQENIWLHRFAVLTAICTPPLIYVGGLVTSTGSGLAVPDWPLSYGMWMPPMVGGILYEHGHRMAAAFVGFLIMTLAVWTCVKEPRRWVRWVSITAFAGVMAQGIVGGLTVLFLLPAWISIIHACNAQLVFCLTVAMALFTSPGWKRGLPKIAEIGEGLHLPALCAITTAAVFVQLILGAVMRHEKSALAIPDFPLSFGRLIPPLASKPVIVHFAHRAWAFVVAALIVWMFLRIARRFREYPGVFRPAATLVALVLVQITLGAFVIWTAKGVIPTSAHVATGALILGTSLLLTLRVHAMMAPRFAEAA